MSSGPPSPAGRAGSPGEAGVEAVGRALDDVAMMRPNTGANLKACPAPPLATTRPGRSGCRSIQKFPSHVSQYRHRRRPTIGASAKSGSASRRKARNQASSSAVTSRGPSGSIFLPGPWLAILTVPSASAGNPYHPELRTRPPTARSAAVDTRLARRDGSAEPAGRRTTLHPRDPARACESTSRLPPPRRPLYGPIRLGRRSP